MLNECSILMIDAINETSLGLVLGAVHAENRGAPSSGGYLL
jgi:hypothetical protein